jgi:hypothetical protein
MAGARIEPSGTRFFNGAQNRKKKTAASLLGRTFVGRPLITMKPPLRTLPACMGTVVDAPASAVSNSSTSSWSDMAAYVCGSQRDTSAGQSEFFYLLGPVARDTRK